ncbi:unnamed protein product [Rotaria magnacalcarata]|nr:unnamed protein product [Rotaria magnacalcarata]CAF2139265.1 unnamed protein product [Rotaria magnacalcarata]CAF2170574.1 unnamed protein product [Rotaria magnacalcarata]CAF3904718.1 unnamed protein product [Rotaria magnacalcarata]CAF3956828.1 unnamed protein product [Rotaria magnacalcarata]
MTTDSSIADSENHLLQPDTLENEYNKSKTIPISTKYGFIIVTQQGPPNRPAIVTYHDIGYNSSTQFHQFFAFPEMMPVTENFTIYHINAPGQDEQAHVLPTSFEYPTLDQLAVSVNDIFVQLDIKSAIGFGIGLGANILARFALQYPSKIYGLIMVNCVSRSMKWLENVLIKRAFKDATQDYWTESLFDYLIWYHLGADTQSSDQELVYMLRHHLEDNVKAKNVIKLLNSFFKRTAIQIDRQNDTSKKADPSRTLQCSVLNITGATSPHKDDVIETNDRCDSATASYAEFDDCGGAVLIEQPSKLSEAIRLFLQGLGYMSHLSIPRYSTANRLAEQTAEYKRQYGSLTKVPRRYSSQVQQGDYATSYKNDFDDKPRNRAGSFSNCNTKF